jgi:hypothetical protein
MAAQLATSAACTAEAARFTGSASALGEPDVGAASRSPEVGATAMRPLPPSLYTAAEFGLVRPTPGHELGRLLQPLGGEVGGVEGAEEFESVRRDEADAACVRMAAIVIGLLVEATTCSSSRAV